MTEPVTSKGGPFFGQVIRHEVQGILAKAVELELRGSIALGIWAAILARFGPLKVLRRGLEEKGRGTFLFTDLARELGMGRSTLYHYLPVLTETGLFAYEVEEPGQKASIQRLRPGLAAPAALSHSETGWAGELGGTRETGAVRMGNRPRSARKQPLFDSGTPGPPPREKETERRKIVGGDELRKTPPSQASEEELAGVVRQVLSRVEELRFTDPEGADTIDELAGNEGGDVDAWLTLLELAGGTPSAEPENPEAGL